ncbi:condensin complex subunit 2 isoform X2 [Citrus clementina]|uniref:condensin complex subunit 2 isoform X2 n=1 Tax=Citrus clementina TaxID=85681 RepID=UPI000CED6720|nr:condensin complex subunit 2 isoform X2 [Citrus x clementina]
MAETLSPLRRQKVAIASRIQSPTSPFFLGSNDDGLERAKARAARAAAIRRKPVTVHYPLPQHGHSDSCLGKDQILELFHNCIKLASENKINQKNTWELNLIDHLCEIIKVEEENDVETNFQKASCTLEAGVKIYSLRVDSVHSEAYKVLGGINRAGQENEQDTRVEDKNAHSVHREGYSKKDIEKKLSPLSTLESSFEALNVKKFDAAFAVDPLYHQTSAQFDEGGAKGLLLNNLGVYTGCQVLFDSQEVPGKGMSCASQHSMSDTIDLSFASEYIEQMVLNMQAKDEISPTLRTIVNQYDEDNRRSSDTFSSIQKLVDQVEAVHNNEAESDGVAFDDCGTNDFYHDDQSSIVDENLGGSDPTFTSYLEETESFSFQDPDTDDRFERVDEYLFLNLGFSSKQNAWAGPDHWKYRKAKGPVEGSKDDPALEGGSPVRTKKIRGRRQPEPDIDFKKALDEKFPDLFAPPKNPKSLLIPGNRAPSNTTLPEDCHYQPEDLIKLFLLPNCLDKRRRRKSSVERQQTDDHEGFPSWGNENMFDGQFDDGNDPSDVEGSDTLVSQPRQVQKVEVEYDKTSKQVDVQTLKETIWVHIQESPQMATQDPEKTVSFRSLLSSFPSGCRAAATIKDISPHLCFICLLHLANEHSLSIQGCANLDDLSIILP